MNEKCMVFVLWRGQPSKVASSEHPVADNNTMMEGGRRPVERGVFSYRSDVDSSVSTVTDLVVHEMEIMRVTTTDSGFER